MKGYTLYITSGDSSIILEYKTKKELNNKFFELLDTMEKGKNKIISKHIKHENGYVIMGKKFPPSDITKAIQTKNIDCVKRVISEMME